MKYLLLTLLLASCTEAPLSTPAPVEPVEEAPITEPPVEVDTYYASWPKKEWSIMLAKALDLYGKEMLVVAPKDFKAYCNADFSKLSIYQKKQFYVALFSGLAKFESSYNPKATYKEGFNDVSGKPVISAGLLQLSIESGNSYGCKLKKTEDLFDPATNLECGVRIANRWVGQRDLVIASQQSPWKGMSRYWSPFRKVDRKASMAKQTKALSFCK